MGSNLRRVLRSTAVNISAEHEVREIHTLQLHVKDLKTMNALPSRELSPIIVKRAERVPILGRGQEMTSEAAVDRFSLRRRKIFVNFAICANSCLKKFLLIVSSLISLFQLFLSPDFFSTIP